MKNIFFATKDGDHEFQIPVAPASAGRLRSGVSEKPLYLYPSQVSQELGL